MPHCTLLVCLGVSDGRLRRRGTDTGCLSSNQYVWRRTRGLVVLPRNRFGALRYLPLTIVGLTGPSWAMRRLGDLA